MNTLSIIDDLSEISDTNISNDSTSTATKYGFEKPDIDSYLNVDDDVFYRGENSDEFFINLLNQQL